MNFWLLKGLDVIPDEVCANVVLELETSRARLQVEKEQLQGEIKEIERRKGMHSLEHG